MAPRNRKLLVRADPSCVDLSMLLQPVLEILPGLLHFAISSHDDNACFYMQNTGLLSRKNLGKLTELFEGHMNTNVFSSYTTVEGELQEEWRLKRERGSSPGAAAHTDIIFVNPLGKESLRHITREYVVGLLKQNLNIGVFFKFGLKLYSLSQNVNFRARKYHKNVRVWVNDKWMTVPKEKAYDKILYMLVEKTCDAVEMYKDSIPEFDVNHFNMFVPVVLENKESFAKRRNSGLDAIAVSVNDRLSRLGKWGGKRIRLR